ncbi:CDP-alcohol phosphatidyltransferase family protein [Candidatus Babeliales bacterium]|nr:CDP-alcohol phosphatidyltransferase family protein [Candidatus Babeliales bacterium]
MHIFVPTLFTLLRIAVTPFVVMAIFAGQWALVLGLFSFGIVTDFLDGFLARKFNAETQFGALFDPVADKIFLVSSFAAIVFSSPIPLVPVWFLYFLVFREFCLLSLGAFVLFFNKNNLQARRLLLPSLWGKASTFFLSVFFIFVCTVYLIYYVDVQIAVQISGMVKAIAFPATASIAIYSLISYLSRAIVFYTQLR